MIGGAAVVAAAGGGRDGRPASVGQVVAEALAGDASCRAAIAWAGTAIGGLAARSPRRSTSDASSSAGRCPRPVPCSRTRCAAADRVRRAAASVDARGRGRRVRRGRSAAGAALAARRSASGV
ncbi:hypothetical protein ACU686_45145 [Yinghuangia aomiensis]